MVRTMGSKVNRIAHWSELFHSRPPRCCWRRGQPQSLGIQLVAGDPVVACWSHQLGCSPAQGQRSSHIDGQVPYQPPITADKPYLLSLTRQWLSQPCQRGVLNLVASHGATSRCPLYSQGLTTWLRQHQVPGPRRSAISCEWGWGSIRSSGRRVRST